MRGPERFRRLELGRRLLPIVPCMTALVLVLLFGTPDAMQSLFLLVVIVIITACLIVDTRPVLDYHLRTATNLIAAIREGDYSICGKASALAGGFTDLIDSINAMAAQLRTERLALHETLQLLSKVLESLDSAVMTFAIDGRLRFVNRAGERLLAGAAATVVGRSCSELGVAGLMGTRGTCVQAHVFAGGSGRWQVTCADMRSQTQAGQLLVIQPIEQALRHEEARAFNRLLRVLGHEINNSLAPIISVADSLQALQRRACDAREQRADLDSGLRLIAQRGAALQRFIAGYAQLANLPPPRLARASLKFLVGQVAGMFVDEALHVDIPADDLEVLCDQDQVQQAVINLLRNALDASAGRGAVQLRWQRHGEHARIEIVDCGEGLPPSDNLFVPFFTTKAGGSGIGLVLSRQIIEAQRGSLELSNRTDGGTGAVAVMELPLLPTSVSGH